jgi:hypothetical protein
MEFTGEQQVVRRNKTGEAEWRQKVKILVHKAGAIAIILCVERSYREGFQRVE